MVDQVRVAASTAASGTFDIAGGNTNTPVGALFYITSAITDDTIAADAKWSFGATDGVKQFCSNISVLDGAASVSSDRRPTTSGCVALHDGVSNLDFEFSFNAFITGGIRLNIDNQASAGFLITAIFFYAADVDNFAVDNIGLGSTTALVDYTGLGFELDGMLTAHCYSSAGNNVHGAMGQGIVVNDVSATPSQRSMAACANNGSGAGDQNTYISNTESLVATLLGLKRWGVTISDIDATGFSHTCSASTSTEMYIVAFKLATGVSFDIFDTVIPTSGNLVESGLSFEPAFASISSLIGPTALNTLSTDSANVGVSVSTFDSSTIFTNNITDEDSADPTVAKSLSSDQFRVLGKDGATNAALASGYSLDATGLTLTLSTNPAAQALGFGWAISGDTGPAPETRLLTALITDEDETLTSTLQYSSSLLANIVDEDETLTSELTISPIATGSVVIDSATFSSTFYDISFNLDNPLVPLTIDSATFSSTFYDIGFTLNEPATDLVIEAASFNTVTFPISFRLNGDPIGNDQVVAYIQSVVTTVVLVNGVNE